MAAYQEYLAMLDSDPGDEGALAELSKLGGAVWAERDAIRALQSTRESLRARGAVDAALRLYDVELEHASGPRKAELLMAKGQFFVEELLNEDSGVQCISRALELQPDHGEARELLDHLHRVKSRWQDIVAKYLEEAEAATEARLSTAMFRAAAAATARYQPNADQIEAYLRRALEIDKNNQKASAHLERLLRQQERWDELLDHLEARVRSSESSAERNAAWVAIAELAGTRRPDPARALEAMKHVIASDPGHPRALALLATHYEAEKDWAALVTLYGNALKARRRVSRPETEIDMLIQIGMLHWKRLDDLEAAEEYFSRLRKLSPAHPIALDFYRTYYVARNEHNKVLQLYRQALKDVADTEPERKRQLMIELAELSEDSINSPDKAIDSWKTILRAEPSNEEARAALRRLYEQTGKWNALLDLIKEQIDSLPKDDVTGRIAGLKQVVAIYRDQLHLDVMVINAYNTILGLDPSNREALDALAQKYDELGRWNDLIAILSRKALLADVQLAERAEILSAIAALWIDRFGNYAQAIKPLEELLEIDPLNSTALGRLKEIYSRRRQWRALISLLDREAEALPETARRAHLADMARLAGERLGDGRLSIQIWNRILELPGIGEGEDGGVDTHTVLQSLAGLYERERRFLELTEILGKQRSLVEDPKAAIAILEKMGAVFADRLKAPQQAADVYREVLDLDPGHARAARVLRELYASARDYDALESLYSGLGQWEELVESYFAIADKLEDRADTIHLLERAARVASEHFQRRDKVARVYERLQSFEPRHLGAARALIPIYRESGKWARLLTIHEILLEQAEPEDRLPIIDDIRLLCEHQLGSKALAFQWTARAYELKPDDGELFADLQRLGADADAFDEVSKVLLRRVSDDTLDVDERVRLYRELGRLAAHRLHDPDKAQQYQRKVLELRPDDAEAMDALEELATSKSEWPALLEILRKRAQLETDPQHELDLLFKIAHIEEERVGQPQAAVLTYERILDKEPESRRAIKSLSRLHERESNWAGLAQVLRRELDITVDADSQAALLLRLGGLYKERLAQLDEALGCFKRALELAPSNQNFTALEPFLAEEHALAVRAEVAKILLPAFDQTGESGKSARALEILRAASADDFERAAHLDRRLAELYESKLAKPELAYEASARLLTLQPHDKSNRSRMSDLAHLLECHADRRVRWQKALDACLQSAVDPAVTLEIATELAELCDHVLQDEDAALIAWRQVLRLDEQARPAYDAVDRILRARESWSELRTLLQARIEHTFDVRERIGFLWEVAELCDGPLSDRDGARVAYEALLGEDPSQLRAYDALAAQHEASADWQTLEDVLGRRADVVTGDVLEDNNLRRARIRAERLGDVSGAVDLAEELLSRRPSNAPARDLLERLLENADVRERVARILEPVYETSGQWTDLCRILKVQSEFSEAPQEACELFARAATIEEEEVGDLAEAARSWLRALAADVADGRPVAALLRLGASLDMWPAIAEGLATAAGAIDPDDLAGHARLLVTFADVARERLGDGPRATAAYEKLLELDTRDPELILRATRALDGLYQQSGDRARQGAVLRRAAEWAESSDERVGLLVRIAGIEEELGRIDEAIATWREVVQEQIDSVVGLDALERLLAATESWNELADILRRRVEQSAELEQRRGLLWRLAELHEARLSNPAESIACLLEILDQVPTDERVLEELSRLYRQGERHDDLLDILERRIGAASAALRIELLFEAALVLSGPLARPSEALDHCAEILSIAPGHEEACQLVDGFVNDEELRERAAEVLVPLYEKRGKFDALVGLLERLAKSSDDSRTVVAHWRRIARLREQHLGSRDGAFEALRTSLRPALAEPDLPEILGELQRLAAELGRLDELVRLYRQIAPEVFDGDLQRRLYLDIADLSRAVLHDQAVAREYYQMVLDAQPDDDRALAALEGLCREAADQVGLYEILIRKADLAGEDLDRRAEVLREAGHIALEHLGRREDASMHWEHVLELIPDDRRVTERLLALYESMGRWHDLTELLEKRLGFALTVDEAVELRYRLGQIYEDQLQDPDAAVENFGAALGGDPDHTGATAALERLLDDPGTRAAAADILEPIHVSQQNWPKLVRIYEIKLEAADDISERLRLTKYIARLYEDQLEDLDGAFHWLGRVFRENPSDQSVRAQLERLASVLQSWAELAQIYQNYLEDETSDAPEVCAVARILAEIYDRRLDRVEPALAAYRRVLHAEPDDRVTFAKVESMLQRAERWLELVALYEEVVHSSLEDGVRQNLYQKLAQVQETRLSDNGRAIDALRALLEINPEHKAGIAELDRLLQAQQNWFDLAELMLAQIDRATSEQQIVEYRLRLAQLREKRLEDVEGAIEQYQAVLSLPGGELALTALERLVVEEAHRERIATILEPVYRANDWWQKLVVILDAQLEFADDPARRREMLLEIAEIHEKRGGDLNLALDALGKAWLEDTSDDALYDRLLSLGRKLRAWPKLIAFFEAAAQDQYDYDLLAKLLLELAVIREAELRDPRAATATLRKLLEVVEDQPVALAELDRLLEHQGEWDDLVPIVERRAELATDPDVRLVLLKRLAIIHERERKDAASAVDAYRNVLAQEDGDVESLDALERLFRTAENWVELTQVLLSKLEGAVQPEVQRALRWALAEVYEEQLKDNFEAVAQYNGVLELNPDDDPALEALERLYSADSQWPELLEILDRRADLQSESLRSDLRFRAATIVERELVELESAIERLAALLADDPKHAGARAALERHTDNVDTLEASSAVLERLYRAESEHEKLAALYEKRLASVEGDVARRSELFAALAEIHEMLRGDVAATFSVWARALRETPEDESVQGQLERLAGAQGNWQQLIDIYEEILANQVDAGLEYHYAMKLAGLYEQSLGDLGSAAEKLTRALGVADDELVPLAELTRIYERDGKHAALADNLARQAEATLDEEQQASLHYRLGDVREQLLSDVAGAVAAYREVLDRSPGHDGARHALERLLSVSDEERATVIGILEPLYEQDGDSARLADLLSAKLAVTSDSFERAGLYQRIAELAEGPLGDLTRASDAFGGWLAEEPQSEDALRELLRLAASVGRWDEVAARLDGIIDTSSADDVRARLALESAQIKLEHLGDPASAERGFELVLTIEPESADSLMGLDQIYRTTGNTAKLARVLLRRAELAFDVGDKRRFYAEAARLSEELGEAQAAADAWKEVLEIDEGDRDAHRAMAGLHRAASRWPELIDILSVAARFATDTVEARALRTEMARIQVEMLGDLDQGIEAWQSVLDLEPAALDAFEALESIHRRREDFLAVQEILVRRVDITESSEQRIALYQRLAQVAEFDREAPDEAVDYLMTVLEIDNSHDSTYQQLERILSAAERHHDVVDLLQRRAEVLAALGNVAAELSCLARAADIWEGPLGNPDAAGEILEKILARDPSSVPALTRLAKIYEGAGDWSRCAEILEKALALGPTGRDAADLYVRMAEVARNQDGDEDTARKHFVQALHFDAYHPRALTAVEEMARDREDWSTVADMVRRRYETCQEPALKTDLAVELSELYGSRLGQPQAVIPLLEAAAATAPADPRVLGPLADLYFHAGRHAEAAPMLEKLANDAKKGRKMKEVARFKQRLGGIFQATGDVTAALAAYEEAFRVDPTNVATMAGLGHMHMAAQEWEKARRVYRSMVLQNIDPTLGITKADVYFQLGQIHVQLGEVAKAKGMFQRGLEADPGHAGLQRALASLG